MDKNELRSFGAMSKKEREAFVSLYTTNDTKAIQQFWRKICKTCCTPDERMEQKGQFKRDATYNSECRLDLTEHVYKSVPTNHYYYDGPKALIFSSYSKPITPIKRVCYLKNSSANSYGYNHNEISFKIIVVGDDGCLYASTATLKTKYKTTNVTNEHVLSATLRLTRFQKWNKFTTNCFVLIKDLDGFMRKYNPYLEIWAFDNNLRLDWAIQCPQLEQVVKMGYTNILPALNNNPMETAEIISRLTKNNAKIGKAKKIWNSANGSTNLLAKTILSLLNDGLPVSLNEWDMLRKLMHTEKIFTEDEIRQVYELKLDNKCLSMFNSILAQKYQGKRIFSLSSLAKYLKKIDIYEAINIVDGLSLLKDYLLCCKECKVKPRIDSDSLKREHDVMARNARLKDDPKADELIYFATQYLRKYEYEEAQFFIRPIVSYADLLDEANQQRNSVACYRELIIGKHAKLFTMRSTHTPSESFVTVELSPDCSSIREAAMAANRKVHNKAVSDFLQRWLKRVKAINKGETVPDSPTPYYSHEWLPSTTTNNNKIAS